jgi:PIN domain nuclease of toxin-antitoxin system
MRILLDSHALLWWAGDPERLAPSARAAIEDPENEIHVSAASLWEIGLKAAKGKLRLPVDFEEILGRNGINSLALTARHAMESVGLPPIHGDPFDRVLVAQCRVEDMILASRDAILASYGIRILPV